MVKIGDRVRFLNATGGGVISKIISKDMVAVTDDDGFDVPTLVRELVVIESPSPMPDQEKKKEKEIETLSDFLEKENTDDSQNYVPQEDNPDGDVLNVAVAFVPHNEKMLSTTNYDVFFVNDSNYYLSYNVATAVGTRFVSKSVGYIQPNTKILMDEVRKEDLNDWEHFRVQLIALKQKRTYELKPAFDVQVKVNVVKFYKLHSFVENDYFDERALIFPIVEKDYAAGAEPSEYELERVLEQKETKFPAKVSQKNKKTEVIVKDLHIHQLLDNTNGLSATDMLRYQMDKFNEAMQENMRQKGQKIIFIHGKGNGVLRKEILKELKLKYSSCYVQDASFQEYGYGATMVTIR